MENIWKINIKKDTLITPNSFIKEQSENLKKLSDNLLYLEIKEYCPPTYETTYFAKSIADSFYNAMQPHIVEKGDELPDNNKKMFYQVNLRSTTVEYYAFNIMTYNHTIQVYPVAISINPDIEMDNYDLDNLYQDDFINALGKIFNSEKMSKTISALYSLSNN